MGQLNSYVQAFPSLEREQHYAPSLVCGVDEAGRGPWAGPVVAAAVILNPMNIPAGIHDSKKLSPVKRDMLYQQIIECSVSYAIAQAAVEEIDALNILGATMLAMRRAVAGLSIMPSVALIDGNRSPALENMHIETMVKGDSRSLSIAAASILAKVTRDRMMQELDVQYPHYGFAKHAGYGTPQHQQALATHGITPHHRKSYAPIRALMAHKEAA